MIALALATASLAAVPQSPSWAAHSLDTDSLDGWPARMVAGDPVGTGLPGALCLHGDTLTMLVGPNDYAAPVFVSDGVTDFDVVWAEDENSQDELMLVLGEEVQWWRWFDDGVEQGFDRETLEGLWANPERVDARVPDAGGFGALAVLDGGSEIYLALLTTNSVFMYMDPIPLSATHVLDMTLVDLDGDALAEVAVQSDMGVEIYDFYGDLVRSHAFPADSASLRAFSDGVTERLVSVSTNAAGLTTLRVLDAALMEAAIDLGAVSVDAISVGDVDADGFDDVAVAHSSAEVFLQQHPGPAFTDIKRYPASELAGLAAMTLVDLDRDGDADGVGLASGKVYVVENTTVDLEIPGPVCAGYWENQGGGTWTAVIQIHEIGQAIADSLEITIWCRESAGAGVGTDPIGADVLPLPQPMPQLLYLPLSAAPTGAELIVEVRPMGEYAYQPYIGIFASLELEAPPPGGSGGRMAGAPSALAEPPPTTPIRYVPPFSSGPLPAIP